jgi:hypothetical protein
MAPIESDPLVRYMHPDEAIVLLREHDEFYDDLTFKLAVTILDQETEPAQIIIDSTLPPLIQQVLLVHEQVQLKIIREYTSPGRHIAQIMPHAHFAGLEAGFALAKELGVLEEYLKIRGQGETPERIRLAPRP